MISATAAVTFVLVVAIAVLASIPGVLLLGNTNGKPGAVAAAATVSLVAMIVITAIIGQIAGLTGQTIPAISIVPFSLAAIVATVKFANGGMSFSQILRNTEWEGWILALVLVFGGFASLAIGFEETPNGALMIHSWYNADWFKHMGHVHGLANYGIPAKDSFGGGHPLHYYWISYIWSGAAASVTGDGWTALAAVNAVTTIYFGLLYFALIRMAGISRLFSLGLGLLAIIVCTPAGITILLLQGYTAEQFLTSGLSPNGPALLALAQVIPQHTLALSTLLAFFITVQPGYEERKPLKVMALLALASIMTVSILLGMTLLISYGLLSLYRDRHTAVPELVVMVLGSAALVFALGVLQVNNPQSAIESPLLQNGDPILPGWRLALASSIKVISLAGFPAVLAGFVIWKWHPHHSREQYARQVVIVLILGALLASMGAQLLLTTRLAAETFIRAALPTAVGTAVACAWAFNTAWHSGVRARRIAVLAALLLTAVALPSLVVRMAWIGNFGDEYTTIIPLDDRRVLAELRSRSEPDDIVWQYPEKPLVGDPAGGDAWAVVFAGRTVANSERATDYSLALPEIDKTKRFFAGENIEVPALIRWIYLSRTLHPQSYDSIRDRLKSDRVWRGVVCYADACLFQRRRSDKP